MSQYKWIQILQCSYWLLKAKVNQQIYTILYLKHGVGLV